MFKVLLVVLSVCVGDLCCRAGKVDDICSAPRNKRLFLGLGESGVLTAVNLTSPNVTLQNACRVDVVTCPSCIVTLSFRFMNLSCHCGVRFNLFSHNPCRCDFVWISEPPYEDSLGVPFCRLVPATEGLGYKSKTRAVRIWIFYTKAHVHAFTLDYKSEENRQFFFGTSGSPLRPNTSSGGFISSPFFPVAYPRDLISEYVFTCLKHSNSSSFVTEDPRNVDDNCRVHLAFTDFQLASSSVLEFYEGGRRVRVVRDTSYRPAFILSTTNSLTIRFCALGQTNAGFKAGFSFVSDSVAQTMVKPNTDCGGYVDNFGGTITMVRMVQSDAKLFDCVWLIKPLKNLTDVKSHQFLKVTTFRGFGGDAELQIRQGLTSESPTLEKVRHPVLKSFQEHIVPLQSGFYVRLRAFFGPASHFAITYALFSHRKCVVLPGFLCKNLRCISQKLTCDGFDHCGDNSDETSGCHRGKVSVLGLWREPVARIQAPNYYFPRAREYSVAKVASSVFLASLAGLIFLMATLALVLHLVETKERESNLQDDLQSVNNFQDCLSDEVSLEDVVIDDPPSYEPPPNYEEVVKMYAK